MIIAVLTVALATCPSLARDQAALQAQSPESFSHALTSVEQAGGGPLLSTNERTSTLEERRTRALARLPTACALSELPPPTLPMDRTALTAILDRREFKGARRRSGGFEDLLAGLWDWLQELLSLRGSQTFAEATRTLVLIAAGLAAVGLLLRAWRQRRAPRRPTEGSAATQAAPKRLEEPTYYLGQARQLLDRDPREAIRNALLALLASLERRRWARSDRARTNREVAEGLEARGAPSDIAAAVRSLCDWYDRAFYSLAPVTPALAAPFVRDIADLTQRLGEPA